MAGSGIQVERSLYVGNAIGCILYGILLVMSLLSMYLLLLAPRPHTPLKKNIFFACYTFVLLIFMTFALLANVLMGQFMWIEHRDFPGGPFAYWTENSTIWFNILGTATDVFSGFMADGLLLYRCYILWGTHLWIVFVLGLVFLASTVLSVIAVVESALPHSTFFQKHTANFGVSWVALTAALNVIITILIVGRIVRVGYEARKDIPPDALKMYTGAISILIESALPFSILGIIFAIYNGKGAPPAVGLSVVWGTFFALSPQLIIIRVALGNAWTRETVHELTTSVAFAPSSSDVSNDNV